MAIATSTPRSYYDPRVNPTPNLSTYVIQSGPFTGMTVQQAMDYKRQMDQQTQQVFGPKKPSTITGSSEGDSALGLLGGVGGAAAIKYGLGQLGSSAASTAAGTAASSAAAPVASSLGGTSLSGTLGSAASGGVDLSAGALGGGEALGGGLMSSALPFLGYGAGAVVGGLQGKGVYDAVQGKDLSLASQAALALPTFGASFLYNPIKKLFGSSKAPERQDRKQARGVVQGAGLMGPDSRSIYSLADGSGYDIRTAPDRKAYNIDFNQEGIGDQVGRVNALTYALLGGGKKQRDITGEMTNAYRSNGQFDQNYRAAADKLGGRNAVYESIANAWKQVKISAQERDAGFAAIDKEYGIANPNNLRWDAGLSGKDLERNQQELTKPQAQSNKPQAIGPAKPNSKPIPKGGKK